jgi:ABC-type dipeptide/oligopeptide/nickel transport system ATPase component
MGVLLVEHDVGMVMRSCDRIYAMEFGRIIAEGTPAEVRNNERVVRAYLGSGSDSDASTSKDASPPKGTVTSAVADDV